ncbi:dihydrodipicolinate synthase family protein, partial [Klebsiella pneumoniae]|nr:dihydrodipicolinate synthase family protein [Klebsiella pneumoniae]
MCGSLGENQTLAAEEKLRVIKATVAAARGRVPVLSGVAESSTEAACRYVKDCGQAGASGFMVMPAMVYKADAREAMTWFRR